VIFLEGKTLFVLIMLVGACIAATAYAYLTFVIPFEVKEPLEVLDYPSQLSLFPGETVEFNVTVQNHASESYYVKLDFMLENTSYQADYVVFSNLTYSIDPGTNVLPAWLFVKHNAPITSTNLIVSVKRLEGKPPEEQEEFTRFEKLEFVSAYAIIVQKEIDSQIKNVYNVTIRIKNTGTAAATIDTVFINGVPHTDATEDDGYAIYNLVFGGINFVENGALQGDKTYTINPGGEVTGYIELISGEDLPTGDVITSGVTIEIMIQTAAGNQYPKSVTLP